MKQLQNKVAAITGAGSGIGRALALALASKGCHIALADVNEQGLSETQRMLAPTGVTTTTHVVNVADRERVYAFADEVKAGHGKANIIINNAGVSLTACIAEMTYEDFEWLMNINFWGVVYGTKAFLPLLREAGEGHIVNISSIFGLLSSPTQSAYNAAKFAVRGFTESLCMELDLYENNIFATSVHPGGVKTNIVASSRITSKVGMFTSKEKAAQKFEKACKTTPESAAEQIVEGIRKKKRRVLVGNDARLLDLVQRVTPADYQRILLKLSGKAYAKRKAAAKQTA